LSVTGLKPSDFFSEAFKLRKNKTIRAQCFSIGLSVTGLKPSDFFLKLLSSEKTIPLEPDALASVYQRQYQSWVKTIRFFSEAFKLR
jgi:hypothetical protein